MTSPSTKNAIWKAEKLANGKPVDPNVQQGESRPKGVVLHYTDWKGPRKENLDVEEILYYASNQTERMRSDMQTRTQNLPVLLNTEQHFDSQVRDGLWEAEITRLSEAILGLDDVNPPEANVLFKSLDSVTALKVVADVIDSILCCLAICVHDDVVCFIEMLLECTTGPKDPSDYIEDLLEDIDQPRNVLIARFVGSNYIKANEPRPLDLIGRRCYFRLIDYISETLARLTHRSASSRVMDHSCLATLAKLSTKLKTIHHTAAEEASQSIQNAILLKQKVEEASHEGADADKKTTNYEALLASIMDHDGMAVDHFFTEYQKARAVKLMFKDILDYIQSHFRALLMEASGFEMEICAYYAKSEAVSSHVHLLSNQSKLFWTEDPNTKQTSIAFAAFSLLHGFMESVPKCKDERHARGNKSINVTWLDTESEAQMEFHLDDIESQLLLLVNVAVVSPKLVTRIERMIVAIAAWSRFEVVGIYRPVKNFKSLLIINPSIYIHDEKSTPFLQRDTVTLSQYALNKLVSEWPKSSGILGQQKYHSNSTLSKSAQKMFKETADLRKEFKNVRESTMKAWEVEGGTVMIPCATFVYSVGVIVLITTLGGICIIGAVGTMIPGVDPSNLLLAIWTAAGAFLILAQSYYVEDWSWYQFLRAESPCQTIDDIHRMSRVSHKHIQMYLLQERRKLSTRGPYNSIFETKDETCGFSIDVPFEIDVLIASGFIVLKFWKEFPMKWGLVCIDELGKPHAVCFEVPDNSVAIYEKGSGIDQEHVPETMPKWNLIDPSTTHDTVSGIIGSGIFVRDFGPFK